MRTSVAIRLPDRHVTPTFLAAGALSPLVFYVERPEHIDVWRVLHGQRDIPAWMQDPDTF